MKVRINATSSGKSGWKQTREGAKRFAFLVSLMERGETPSADLAFDSISSDGVRIANFSGAMEMWFAESEALAIKAKLDEVAKQGKLLVFEFTASSTSKSAVQNGVGDNAHRSFQTITLNADRFQPRRVHVLDAPSIEGL